MTTGRVCSLDWSWEVVSIVEDRGVLARVES